MKWWTILDSVGLMAYREREASKRMRGIVNVCLMKKCLRVHWREAAFLRLENFSCSLGWSMVGVGEEECDDGILIRSVSRPRPVSSANTSQSSLLDFLRRHGVQFSVIEANWSVEPLRSGENSGVVIVAS